jgi:antitoxin FitA
MTTISIPIAEDRFLRLKELAKEADIAPEDLLRLSVEEWLGKQNGDFAAAAAYVLSKNAELYRRLAQ